MLPRKKFENLRFVMAILVLFEFLEKFVTFLAPNFECLTNDAFCSHSFDYACLRRQRHIVMKRFEITENFYSSKALSKMAGGGMHPPPWIRPCLLVDIVSKTSL